MLWLRIINAVRYYELAETACMSSRRLPDKQDRIADSNFMLFKPQCEFMCVAIHDALA